MQIEQCAVLTLNDSLLISVALCRFWGCENRACSVSCAELIKAYQIGVDCFVRPVFSVSLLCLGCM